MTIKLLTAFAVTILVSSPAFAHASGHGDVATNNMAQHIMQSPFHIAGIGAVMLIAGTFARRYRKRKAEQQKK